MGQEISQTKFSAEEQAEFQRRLARETELLAAWLRDGELAAGEPQAGYELEAWLVDQQLRPAPRNGEFLEALNDPLVVSELARFNVEINDPPLPLSGSVFSRLHQSLAATWRRCRATGAELGLELLMTGIPATLRDPDLCLANMTPLARYRALNDEILALRQDRPIRLDIQGKEHLALEHQSVMLEAAATSFQIHLRVDPKQAVRYYNAAKIAAAPLVGLAANSPFLFGKDLWAETRIPLFEQSVAVGHSDQTKRVSFGLSYARDSIMECFEANRRRYPVLLAQVSDEPEHRLPHLRLHNGTIWRWNRPLIGFDPDGRPHLRIEHRTTPAGPTPSDSIANAAFCFGLVTELARAEPPPERQMPFARAKTNFYAAARHGLDAEIAWLDCRGRLRDICGVHLVDLAAQGLRRLDIEQGEIDQWLGIIRGRLATGRTGSDWQRAWVARHGRDWHGLTRAYIEHQASDRPVHEWQL